MVISPAECDTAGRDPSYFATSMLKDARKFSKIAFPCNSVLLEFGLLISRELGQLMVQLGRQRRRPTDRSTPAPQIELRPMARACQVSWKATVAGL
ncbi:hypothetical protein VTI74DRAFT_1296 [Chaetomium olivicolor]